MQLPTKPDTTPTYLFNPSKEDFIYPYDGVPYIVPSRKMISFPKWLADHLARHLAQKLASEDSERIHYEERLKNQLERIYIKL